MRIGLYHPNRFGNSVRHCLLWWTVALLWLGMLLLPVEAVIPSAMIKIRKTSKTFYSAPGTFSADLSSERNAYYRKLVLPTGDADGCNPTAPSMSRASQYMLMVARGNCTFADKARAAQNIGARGLVVYNSLEGVYQENDYASEYDYDCANGEGYVDPALITYPISSSANNDLMPASCTASGSCSSGMCVFTNVTDEAAGGVRVCCAWDLYLTMGSNTDDDSDEISIPAVFVRFSDASSLFSMTELKANTLDVLIYERPDTFMDLASILIWFLAIFTVYLGAKKAAEDDRDQNYYVDSHIKGDNNGNSNGTDSTDYEYGNLPDAFDDSDHGSNHSSSNRSSKSKGKSSLSASLSNSADYYGSNTFLYETDDDLLGDFDGFGNNEESVFPFSHSYQNNSSSNSRSNNSNTSNSSNNSSPKKAANRNSAASSSAGAQGDNIDISFCQAILFVLISSMFLLLLYFVDLYAVVSAVYLAAAAIAVAFVTFEPMLRCMLGPSTSPDNCCSIFESPRGCCSRISGGWMRVDCALSLALLLGAALSMLWYIYRSDDTFVWVIQDLLGINVCILFLTTIRLPNLKVAFTLLSLAFCYDVFFVFISPYVFSSSVMLSVAEGSSSSSSKSSAYLNDENYCEKYPDSADCESSTLPMLLTVPTFSSYTSSESILGLGDMVLPGLLLVLTARIDIRRFGYFDNLDLSTSYFYSTLLAYSVGLLLANYAVDYFETGQPALLYIVPLTLGTVYYKASSANVVELLWDDLPAMKIVARPLGYEEQEALLQRSNVVEAEASLFFGQQAPSSEVVVVKSLGADRKKKSKKEKKKAAQKPITSKGIEAAESGAENCDV